VFDTNQDTALFLLKTMDLMKYDALSLGAPDLQFGYEFIEKSRAEVSFPYVASNLIYKDGPPASSLGYIIKETGGIKVAIFGVVDPEDLAKFISPKEAENLRAVPPETALAPLVSEARTKADLVVLLSQLPNAKLVSLMNAVKGIDLAITAGCYETTKEKPPAESMVINIRGNKGVTLGILKIALDGKGAAKIKEDQHIELNDSFTEDPEIAKRMEAHKNALKIKEEKEKKELEAGLQMTPEEFMKQYQKQQTNNQEGEVR
jgi:2',3'-cyclic-nucleotide 2'-phosphodiesterase (5'-nucleotidase family)